MACDVSCVNHPGRNYLFSKKRNFISCKDNIICYKRKVILRNIYFWFSNQNVIHLLNLTVINTHSNLSKKYQHVFCRGMGK